VPQRLLHVLAGPGTMVGQAGLSSFSWAALII
jgi:hypothetical protein